MILDLCLPEFSSIQIITHKCHIDECTNVRYNMILGRDLLTAPGLDLKISENIIIEGKVPCEGCSTPMVYLSNYDFTSITDKTVRP